MGETLEMSRSATLANLVPHLASNDSEVRKNALIVLETLGYREDFLSLATTIGGEAGLGAVAKTVAAETVRGGVPESARLALADLVSLQANATFSVSLDDAKRGSAFIAGSPDVVVTAADVLKGWSSESTLTLHSSRGDYSVQAQVLLLDEEADLAVIKAPAPLGAPLPLLTDIDYGEEVIRTLGDGRVDVGGS